MKDWINKDNPKRNSYLTEAYFKLQHNMYDDEHQQITGGTVVVTGGNACIKNELDRLDILNPQQVLVHEIHEPVLAWYQLTKYIKRMSVKFARKIVLNERNILWSNNQCINFISNDLQGSESTNSRKYYEDMDLWGANQVAHALIDNPNQTVGWLTNMSVRNIGKQYLNNKLDQIIEKLSDIKVTPRLVLNNLDCYNRTMYTVGAVFTTSRKHTKNAHRKFSNNILEELLKRNN